MTSLLLNESHLQVLRQLDKSPTLSQRELAEHLGMSVGKANYCINALVDRGLIKVVNFCKNTNKKGYFYYLTSQGLKEKSVLTLRFIQIKTQEYEALKEELKELKNELHGS
ncbi:MarR family EPS-associated transcriptional regulator [Alcaligenes endophyticus]|uniref:MarR family EPS-associated transcriptional regulator n=1 Tax=Alcaligenes endophyticus TaxID=1929088 RepID=A0ABT8EG64_9BURK|nr:MarR family EPS-associated transcriptional regulator [Alcaligenes endophyticus]MCX5590197.1 MarR family EPS-associated transcriptional regulator [Alcaligenes endophyticus]MDN4120140.1 MarR family EPS-associated transcriptional regulator [Alcaligenes endophyticus]